MRLLMSTITRRMLMFVFTAVLLHSLPAKAQSQPYRSYEHWYIGISFGSANFYGDISGRNNTFSNINPFSGDFYRDRGFMYGLMMTKRFSGVFWTRLNLLTGTLGSQEDDLKLYFKSNLLEFSGICMINLSEVIGGSNPDRLFNAYAFAGAGLLSYSAWKRKVMGDSLIDSEGAGRRKALDFMIPMGIGIDYRINNQFTVNAEFTFRNLSSDRLDAHADGNKGQEGFGLISVGFNYQFDMPEGLFKRNTRHTGKSTDPAIRAYNRRKATVMKTEGYKQGMRNKRIFERQKREWLIMKLFKKTTLDMATE